MSRSNEVSDPNVAVGLSTRETRKLAAVSFGAHHRSLGSGRRVVKDQGRVPCVDAARGTLSHGPVYGATKKQEQCSSSARRESSRSPAHAHENAENGRTRRSPLFPGGSTGRLFPHAKRQHVCSCRSWDRWAFVFNLSMDPAVHIRKCAVRLTQSQSALREGWARFDDCPPELTQPRPHRFTPFPIRRDREGWKGQKDGSPRGSWVYNRRWLGGQYGNPD
jgi:hypothetical protein